MKQKFQMPDGEIVEKDMPIFKTPYNHDTNFESDRTGYFSLEPSLTKQEFKDEVDINTIINRFLKTGEPPPFALPEHFLELDERKDYFTMASQVAEANGIFYELPARIRSEFQNDPTRWADAVVNAVARNDVDALNAMGIDATKKPQDGDKGAASTPVATPPANAAPAAPAAPAQPAAPGAPKSDT